MKRTISLTTIVFLLGSLFFMTLPLSRAGVPGMVLDQSYEETAGSSAIIIDDNAKVIQTLKVTKNRIVSVEVYLKNRKVNSTITLKIYDGSSLQVIATSSHQITNPPGDTWETFAFDSPFVTVTPGGTYRLHLEVNDAQTKWAYNNVNQYADGYFMAMGFPTNWDACFRVYGLNYSETAPSDNPASENNASTSEQTAVEVDPTIKAPELKYIEKNSQRKEAPINNVEIKEKDTLILGGSSFAEANIVLFIGDLSFSNTADTEGNWTISIDHSDLKEGSYDVKAQAQNAEGKGSEEVKFFALKKVAQEKPKATEEVKPTFWQMLLGPYYPLFLGVSLILLLILLATLILLIKKRRNANKPPVAPLEKQPDKKPENILNLRDKN